MSEVEANRLEVTEPPQKEEEPLKKDFWEKKIFFHSKICNFVEKCQYFGKNPPFCNKVLNLKEPG